MKLAKKNKLLLHVTMICMCLLVGNWHINYMTVQASQAKNGKIISNGKQIKIGKYYYKSSLSGLYVSKEEGEKGTGIVETYNSGSVLTVYNDDAYYTSKYIYYSTYSYFNMRQSETWCDIYRVKHNGEGKEHLFKMPKKYGGKVNLVYNDTYMEFVIEPTFLNSNYSNYFINLKNGKISYKDGKEKALFTQSGDENVNLLDKYHYKKYYTVKSIDDIKRAWVYEATTGKFTLIGKNIEDIGIGGKYVYYLEQVGDVNDYKSKLVRCDINGKNKERLEIINGRFTFYNIFGKSCILKENNSLPYRYYKYSFSTGKMTEIDIHEK